MSKDRPIGVTVLAILAGVAAVLAALHALQALGIFPYLIGPFTVHSFSFWSFLMWALMVWVWVWLVQMLWRVDKQAWLFMGVITVFNLILDFTVMLGAAAWADVCRRPRRLPPGLSGASFWRTDAPMAPSLSIPTTHS